MQQITLHLAGMRHLVNEPWRKMAAVLLPSHQDIMAVNSNVDKMLLAPHMILHGLQLPFALEPYVKQHPVYTLRMPNVRTRIYPRPVIRHYFPVVQYNIARTPQINVFEDTF